MVYYIKSEKKINVKVSKSIWQWLFKLAIPVVEDFNFLVPEGIL